MVQKYVKDIFITDEIHYDNYIWSVSFSVLISDTHIGHTILCINDCLCQ